MKAGEARTKRPKRLDPNDPIKREISAEIRAYWRDPAGFASDDAALIRFCRAMFVRARDREDRSRMRRFTKRGDAAAIEIVRLLGARTRAAGRPFVATKDRRAEQTQMAFLKHAVRVIADLPDSA